MESSNTKDIEAIAALCQSVTPYTMESISRISSFHELVEATLLEGIPGDIVECGVWKGGMMMLAASLCLEHFDLRRLWLYDTYTGMSKPGEQDVAFNGEMAINKWLVKNNGENVDWCLSPLEEVKANLASTNYPQEMISYIKGDVLETLKVAKPDSIALLRLDTDWYASTKIELETLFPLLSPGGFLIIADFSDWQGARKAAEEYFSGDRSIHGAIVDGTFVGRKS
jgi:O-methyltransferase